MLFSLTYKMRLSSELASCLPKCKRVQFSFNFSFSFFNTLCSMQDLSSLIRDQICILLPGEVKQLNHWTTMKVPESRCICIYMYVQHMYTVMWIYIQSCDYINSVWSENITHNVIRINKNLRIAALCTLWQIPLLGKFNRHFSLSFGLRES